MVPILSDPAPGPPGNAPGPVSSRSAARFARTAREDAPAGLSGGTGRDLNGRGRPRGTGDHATGATGGPGRGPGRAYCCSGAGFMTLNGTPNGSRTAAYRPDRQSTRLNSSHVKIPYAVFSSKK